MGCAPSTPRASEAQQPDNPPLGRRHARRDGVTGELSGLDFARVMKDAVARSVMLDYARSEHSDENLLFYDQAASFRRTFVRRENEPALHATDVEQMRKEAEKIVKEFLRPDAPNALNLPSNLLTRYNSAEGILNECSPNMFDPISRVVYKTVEDDTFLRFKFSKAAADLMARLPELKATRSSGGRSTGNSNGSVSPVKIMPSTAEEMRAAC